MPDCCLQNLPFDNPPAGNPPALYLPALLSLLPSWMLLILGPVCTCRCEWLYHRGSAIKLSDRVRGRALDS
jgi:hypothetical protein